ncbi:exonuclease SbcC [Motilibacter peucedani]|uniref:Nuclease SbcCD subunit C n=1 Tax=Motilibacter peucedani TaxID=598650 RepID=A0A420XSV2_9ACTN|nr:SMC family ATPase [Motilibacter peucedani]RKS77897.1 exonuclease SbcC [Motilibacter peucedani]
MRLHTLRMTAFGPFAGTEEVDFDALHDAGLFLLSGPTGAGKTSILDAVVFALYGVVPGARQGAGRLRSDHASPAVTTEVRLELTCRGRRFRVTRRPAWDRPKKRGTGTVREQAGVLVEEVVCDEPVVRATRLDEAGHLLGEVLGMTAEQFCQVVLLPQGEFARFLRADAETRRAILQTLFATERFAAVEAWLAERRRESARSLADREEDLRVLLARAAQEAGAPAPEAADDPAGWLRALVLDARGRADAAGAALPAAEQAVEGARARLDAARGEAALQDAARALHGRAQRAAASRARHGQLADELARARRALPVRPLLDALARAERDLDRAAAELAARAGAAGLEGQDAPPGAGGPSLRSAAQDRLAEASRLGGLAEEEAHLPQLVASEQAERAVAADALAEHQRLVVLRDALPGLRAHARAALEAAVAAASEARRLSPLVQEAEARVAAGRERDALEAALAEARAGLLLLTDSAQDERERWLDARSARLDAMAAELAQGLVDGDACPVCGASEHPAPARAQGDAAADEDRARQAFELAEARRAQAAETVSVVTARHAAVAALAGSAGLAELQSAWRQLVAELELATEAAAGQPAAHERLLQLDEQDRTLGERLSATTARAAQAAASAQARADQLAAARERLDAARGDDPSVARRAERLRRVAALLVATAEAAEAHERQRAACSATREQAVAAVAEAAFDDLGAARAACRTSAATAELEAELRGLEQEAAALADRLAEQPYADGGLERLLAAAPPDLPGAELELAAASRALAQAGEDAALARRRSAALEQLFVTTDEALRGLAPERERHAVLASLSALAEGSGGDNTLRMRLSAYVLAARLEQVALAAGERLLRMTSGRYSLAHTAAATSGRGRAGLGLTVLDAWTGVERDPATLSGGEAFSASLALALGLADVVAAEAGGAVLETLFIDEGFGSLDDETLDEVLDVLDGLREGGRVVGLVSHVSELRARVPAQVRVAKGRDGSRVSLTGCAPSTSAGRATTSSVQGASSAA